MPQILDGEHFGGVWQNEIQEEVRFGDDVEFSRLFGFDCASSLDHIPGVELGGILGLSLEECFKLKIQLGIGTVSVLRADSFALFNLKLRLTELPSQWLLEGDEKLGRAGVG